MKTKATKRVLSLILTVLMIVPLVATIGCGKKEASVSDLAQVNNAAEVNDAVDETTEKTKAETEAEKADLSDALSSGTVDTIAFDDLKNYTIVYYDSVYAKECATRIRDAIKARTGNTLTIAKDTATAETAKEILVGKTDREESAALRATYSRPNVCYDVKVDGTKLVVMAEGYATLNRAADKIEKYMADNANTAFEGSVYDCDISPTIDTLGTSMIDRAEGTDLRVFHWNMAAVLITLGGNYKDFADVNTDAKRAEVIADIILQYNPDIITTNEMYNGHNSKLYPNVLKELSEYYTVVGDPELDGCTLEEMTAENATTKYIKSDTGHDSYDPDKDQPIVGAYDPGKVSIPENILYRNDDSITFINSAWSYLPEYEAEQATKANNPLGRVFYHGYHTAVFKNEDGKYFAVSVGHYQDNTSENKDATIHMASIANTITAAKQIDSKVTDSIPTIVTGDMYTSYTTKTANGYKAWADAGYVDSQRIASVNANGNITHGTFHDGGVRQITRISEDFIWTKNNITVCRFKVLTSEAIDDASDHYPVMADIQFTK